MSLNDLLIGPRSSHRVLRRPSLICALDMPGMMGCGDYKSMCMNPNSVVQQCKLAVAPVPSTMGAMKMIKSICAEMPSMNGCSSCVGAFFVCHPGSDLYF